MSRLCASLALLAAFVLIGPPSSAAAVAPPASSSVRWAWPVPAPLRIARAYVAPAHEYGPGHRGIDLVVDPADAAIVAPADGVVAFAGEVGGRPVLTIDHGGGIVSTLEPVEALRAVGEPVDAGSPVATLAGGGHVPAGEVHLGARRDGAYINPLSLLGGVPRAILLPCCRGVTPGGAPPGTRP